METKIEYNALCFVCDSKFKTKNKNISQKVTACCSKECVSNLRARISGKNIVYLLCNMCDKLVSKTKNKANLSKYGLHFCSVGCTNKYWATVDSSYYQKDRKSKVKYYGPDWNSKRRLVRNIQQFKCMDCKTNEKDYGQELSVHHIVPFVSFDSYREANVVSNLIAVCEPCHRKRHTGENHPHNFTKFGLNAYNSNSRVRKQHRENGIKIANSLAKSNFSIDEIALKFDCSVGTVMRVNNGLRWKAAHNYRTPIRKTQNDAQEEIAKRIISELVSSTRTYQEIATKVGCQLGTVGRINNGKRWNHLHNYKIPLRSK